MTHLEDLVEGNKAVMTMERPLIFWHSPSNVEF